MVIGVSTDILFPLAQQQALADALAEKVADVAFVPLDSLQGHDSFLVDMDRVFAGYNEVWAETLGHYGPTRTTLAIRALPTPIAVEMKVIAKI